MQAANSMAKMAERGGGNIGTGTFPTIRIALFVVAGAIVFLSTILKVLILRNAPPNPMIRLSRLKNAAILSAALAEMPAVFGFVLYMFGRGLGDFLVLAAISVYMLIRHFPRRGFWDEYVRSGPANAVR